MRALSFPHHICSDSGMCSALFIEFVVCMWLVFVRSTVYLFTRFTLRCLGRPRREFLCDVVRVFPCKRHVSVTTVSLSWHVSVRVETWECLLCVAATGDKLVLVVHETYRGVCQGLADYVQRKCISPAQSSYQLTLIACNFLWISR